MSSISVGYIMMNTFVLGNETDFSRRFAEAFQKHQGKFIYYFLTVITDLGFPGTMVLLGLLAIFQKEREKAYRIVFFALAAGGIIGTLKLVYHSPRPWYSNKNIKVYECKNTDFGRPSGHAFFSTFIVLMLYKLLVYDRFHAITSPTAVPSSKIEGAATDSDLEKQTDALPATQALSVRQKFAHILLGLILMIFLGLVGLSRIYLGDHSLDQVCLGWSFGVLCFIEFAYWMDDRLQLLFSKLLSGEWRNWKYFWPIFITLYAVVISIPYIYYQLDNSKQIVKPAWLKMIHDKCPGEYTHLFGILGLSLYICTAGTGCFGLILGFDVCSRSSSSIYKKGYRNLAAV